VESKIGNSRGRGLYDLLGPGRERCGQVAGWVTAAIERSISGQPKIGNFWTCVAPAPPTKVSQLLDSEPLSFPVRSHSSSWEVVLQLCSHRMVG
jgi:hypothetical protein